jgi:hypothetical protein
MQKVKIQMKNKIVEPHGSISAFYFVFLLFYF